MSPNRVGAVSLAPAGLLFVLCPAIRPWHDELTVPGATASMSSPAWVAAHFFAIRRLAWRAAALEVGAPLRGSRGRIFSRRG